MKNLLNATHIHQATIITLGPNVLNSILTNLKPGTTYEVTVTPIYGALTGGVGSDEEATGW